MSDVDAAVGAYLEWIDQRIGEEVQHGSAVAMSAGLARPAGALRRRRWLLGCGVLAALMMSMLWAGMADGVQRDASRDLGGALLLPAAPPEQAAAMAHAVAYAARIEHADGVDDSTSAQRTSVTSVNVSGTVPPIITLVRDDSGLAEVWVNTATRDAAEFVYQLKIGSVEGHTGRIDERTWKQAREVLVGASAGPGRIWAR